MHVLAATLPANITLLTQVHYDPRPRPGPPPSRVLSAVVFFASLLQIRHSCVSTPRSVPSTGLSRPVGTALFFLFFFLFYWGYGSGIGLARTRGPRDGRRHQKAPKWTKKIHSKNRTGLFGPLAQTRPPVSRLLCPASLALGWRHGGIHCG